MQFEVPASKGCCLWTDLAVGTARLIGWFNYPLLSNRGVVSTKSTLVCATPRLWQAVSLQRQVIVAVVQVATWWELPFPTGLCFGFWHRQDLIQGMITTCRLTKLPGIAVQMLACKCHGHDKGEERLAWFSSLTSTKSTPRSRVFLWETPVGLEMKHFNVLFILFLPLPCLHFGQPNTVSLTSLPSLG